MFSGFRVSEPRRYGTPHVDPCSDYAGRYVHRVLRRNTGICMFKRLKRPIAPCRNPQMLTLNPADKVRNEVLISHPETLNPWVLNSL